MHYSPTIYMYYRWLTYFCSQSCIHIQYDIKSHAYMLTHTSATVAYPGLVKGGCSALFVIFAHAQIVGRFGFEREYVRIVNLRSAHSFDRLPMHI